jgi:hypothetical protein
MILCITRVVAYTSIIYIILHTMASLKIHISSALKLLLVGENVQYNIYMASF